MPYFLNMFMREALKKIWHRNLFDSLATKISSTALPLKSLRQPCH